MVVRAKFVIGFVALALMLGACGANNTITVTVTPAPASTDTAIPTVELSSTPVVPLAILVIPPTLEAETSELYQKTVYDLAQASGMRFQVRNTLTTADLEPGLQVVIALPPDPGIVALATAAPNVQFLAINIPDVAAGGNISVLGGNSQIDIAGFLAGYTAALITDDYRIGMIMPKDNPDAIRAYNSFINGMVFYCGTCRPVYYPAFCIAENLTRCFPQYVEIPAEEDKSKYGPYADYLIVGRNARTVFVHPAVATDDLLTYIGTTGTSMIGMSTPGQMPAGWVMTIQPDVIQAIQNAWGSLISGQGGLTVQSPLGLGDVDPSLLSPGRFLKVEQMLRDLQAGFVRP
jgi:hypothetical protein